MAIHSLQLRKNRKNRIRKKVSGTLERPRVSVYKSNMAFYAQLIDDVDGKTLVSVSSLKLKGNTLKEAEVLGVQMAEKAKEKKIAMCVFDRNGYRFHGKVKVFADAARGAGLKF
jgi:large subunit ribosomal protein L18